MASPEAGRVRDFAVLLRSVTTPIHGTGLLYEAADLLTNGRTQKGALVNEAITTLVARLLDLPTDDPTTTETIERVLRSLPESDKS